MRTTTQQRHQRHGQLTSFFDKTTNLWSNAFLAGKGGDFNNDDDDGNNDHKDDDNDNARTTSTSFFDTTTNLWSDAFLAAKGVISIMMRTVTTTMKTMNKDNDEV